MVFAGRKGMPEPCTVLIVSLMHQRRQSLHALLQSMIEGVQFVTTDFENARSVALENELDVVIVDKWFAGDEVKGLLEKIKDMHPLTRCIVLDDAYQGGHLPALSQADVILESDLPTSRVAEVVRQQLDAGCVGKDSAG
jgi:DNA-binding NtrC family response regulator